MDAVTVAPGQAGSARLEDIAEPDPRLGSVVVEALAVGVCGTDVEIASGLYGWAPPGRERLVLGHESIGRVLDSGSSGLSIGDLVVGIVRRPDPVPCPNCAVGEWDMCSNGSYTERGIKQADGFMSERWRIEPEYAVPVDHTLGILGVLLEPTTVVVKAWEQILTIGHRTFWDPEQVLVVGAGPIGLLAALIGALRGFEVHVLDRASSGPKPDLVAALGATYHCSGIDDLRTRPDIVLECTGVPELVVQALSKAAPGAVICLTGVGSPIALPNVWNQSLVTHVVLNNLVVFGSVNANRRHYYRAAKALARADNAWLEGLITSRVAPDEFERALERRPENIKVVVQFEQR
jgi:glucose 1-dehydrogenase